VVGWAETATKDPSCVAPQQLDIEAVVYEPNGKVRPLPTLPGDHLAGALGINDNGAALFILPPKPPRSKAGPFPPGQSTA
jgi:hypothetical protein